MPHTDGMAYHPEVVCLNLGSSRVLSFWKNHEDIKNNKYLARIYCEPRSVVMFSDQFYKDYLHGVEYVSEEKLSINESDPSFVNNWEYCSIEIPYDPVTVEVVGTRYSITIRHVYEE